MRVCFIQYGDMRETIDLRSDGLGATYRAQYYSVDHVVDLAKKVENVSVIAIGVKDKYDDQREGMNVYGLDYYGGDGAAVLLDYIHRTRPTHIVMRTPIPSVFVYAKEHGAALFPMLADSFIATGWSPRDIKARFKSWQLGRALNDPSITAISNHNVAACADLVRIGVNKDKIVPWDWPAERQPRDYAVKTLSESPELRLLYVGAVSQMKGVSDALHAFSGSEWLCKHCSFDIVGTGEELETIKALAATLPGGEKVTFHGRQPNDVVFTMMREADLVLVPSWHAYSEGLPGTIYEALTVRTPILMSDHPMFQAYLTDEEGVVFAPERNSAELGATAQRLLADSALYRRLSESTEQAFDKIRCPNLWHEVLDAWLAGDPDGYLRDRCGRW